MTTPFTKEDPDEVLQIKFLDENGRISKESILGALKPSYPVNYYLNLIILALCGTIYLLWNYGVIIVGNQMGFFCNDPLFSHKYNGDTVTATILGITVVISLPVVYFIVEYARQKELRNIFKMENFLELYIHLKQAFIGLGMVGGFTVLAKTIVGEHRPHFFYTCRPDSNSNCTSGTYISSFRCTNLDVSWLELAEASRSFPSGHSSVSWFQALYCIYVIYRRLPARRLGTAFKMLLIGICFIFALICSLTRITDRRHHWWDVLAGTAIGVIGVVYSIRETEKELSKLRKQSLNQTRIQNRV